VSEWRHKSLVSNVRSRERRVIQWRATPFHFVCSIDNRLKVHEAMGEFIPEYLIREQMAVGALVVFGVLRVIAAAVASEKGWRIAVVDKCFITIAVLYCLPQLFDLLCGAHFAAAELECKSVGCAIALFCAPNLSHRIGYE
jgi:hypothetical protein